MDNEPEQIFVLNSSENVPLATTQKETPATQVNLEDVLDFSTVCRTCATITEFVIPIFQGEGLQNNLAEKIHKYLPIKVSEEDELPVVVCYQCASTLLACHELAQCSRHAETALRARLPHLPRRAPPPPPPPPLAVQQNTDVEPSQTNENVEKNQPETKSGAAARRPCIYCPAQCSDSVYEEHLVAAHSDLLFHCEECDTYVDRKDFIRHMSLHAVQYSKIYNTGAGAEKKAEVSTRGKIEGSELNGSGSASPGQKEKRDDLAERREAEPRGPGAAGDARVDEFSDHSDAEDRFEPLPESVFEAIEDSQDARPAAPAPAPAKKVRTCPICSKTYTASSSYFYHMKYFHRGSREHECGECGRRFGTRGALAQHAPLHTGERRRRRRPRRLL